MYYTVCMYIYIYIYTFEYICLYIYIYIYAVLHSTSQDYPEAAPEVSFSSEVAVPSCSLR